METSDCIFYDPKTQKNYVNLVSLEQSMIEGHVDVYMLNDCLKIDSNYSLNDKFQYDEQF